MRRRRGITAVLGVWSGWRRYGGHLVGRPAVTTGPEIYVTGTDQRVWAYYPIPGGPQWAALGGTTPSGPGAAHSIDPDATEPTDGWVVATGSDHHVWARSCTFGRCTSPSWTPLGGQAYDAPGVATAPAPGTATDIAVRGEHDGAIY